MTAQVIDVSPKGRGRARAVQIPEQLTGQDIDDVLYEFGFEWFGTDRGVQRLVAIDDDCIEDYDDALDVMRAANAQLALFDRDQARWVPLLPGDWVVEPQDDYGDGFIRLSAAEFENDWEPHEKEKQE